MAVVQVRGGLLGEPATGEANRAGSAAIGAGLAEVCATRLRDHARAKRLSAVEVGGRAQPGEDLDRFGEQRGGRFVSLVSVQQLGVFEQHLDGRKFRAEGDLDAGVQRVRRAIDRQPNWIKMLDRLLAEIVPVGAALIERLNG